MHLPNTTGRFHLYSDTSKFTTGSALYQKQNRKPKLIAYASKRLSEAAKNYSITKSELCRLAIKMASFCHLLKRDDFDAKVDHLSFPHIIKNKAEPATVRIKRLLELISSYSFNLYYRKGKDMVLSDFYQDKTTIIPILMKQYLFPLICTKCYMENIIIQKIIWYKHDPKLDPVDLNSQRFMA